MKGRDTGGGRRANNRGVYRCFYLIITLKVLVRVVAFGLSKPHVSHLI